MTEPPRSLLLVHGAGSGPWVFHGWEDHFPEVTVTTVDLQEGLNISHASMSNYAYRITSVADQLERPLALCGWSMGGLVALMAAKEVRSTFLILIEASAPGEVQGFDPSIEPRADLFDSEATYGAFPPGVRARPESQLARDERKRGISIPSLPCPALVISGKSHPIERGSKLAEFYRVPLATFPDLNHWELLESPDVKGAIRNFLGLSPMQRPGAATDWAAAKRTNR